MILFTLFKKKLYLTGLLLMQICLVQSQTLIRGMVRDAVEQSPLGGVSVTETGTGNTVQTDQNGNFMISVTSARVILLFSFIGYESKEVATNRSGSLSVALQPTAQELDQVVIVGYGTQKKVNLTG